MIVLHDREMVIITPPKCATVAAHAAWCNGDSCREAVSGPQHFGGVGLQTTEIPESASGYTTVCLIRNPVTRCLSLWNSYRQSNKRFTFDDFIADARKRKTPLFAPVADVVSRIHVDEFWPIEILDHLSDLNDLPVPRLESKACEIAIKIGGRGVARPAAWSEITFLYRDDFIAGDYSIDIDFPGKDVTHNTSLRYNSTKRSPNP